MEDAAGASRLSPCGTPPPGENVGNVAGRGLGAGMPEQWHRIEVLVNQAGHVLTTNTSLPPTGGLAHWFPRVKAPGSLCMGGAPRVLLWVVQAMARMHQRACTNLPQLAWLTCGDNCAR